MNFVIDSLIGVRVLLCFDLISQLLLVVEFLGEYLFALKMFDFERFLVYQKAKAFSFAIKKNVLTIESLERISKDQLRRASLSVALNIAEGASRFSRADKRNFYVIARASAIECVAILDILKLEETITNELYQELYLKAEEISRMLYSLIRQLEKKV